MSDKRIQFIYALRIILFNFFSFYYSFSIHRIVELMDRSPLYYWPRYSRKFSHKCHAHCIQHSYLYPQTNSFNKVKTVNILALSNVQYIDTVNIYLIPCDRFIIELVADKYEGRMLSIFT